LIPLLKIKNLSTGYGKKEIIFNVSFEINKGEVIMLVGNNGSGKSTLLKAISGILPLQNNGKIIFDAENITGDSTSVLLGKGLLYIPQKNNLFDDLTVKENLEMAGLTIVNKKVLKERIDNTLSIFSSLVPHLQRKPLKLSGGERQLLTLALTSLHNPKMILCDEPYAGLSGKNIAMTTEYFKKLNKQCGITFIIVEHRIKECAYLANRLIGLKLGRIYIETEINSNFNLKELNSLFV